MAGRKGSRTIVTVNPFRCRMSPMHDRFSEYITEETCKDEIESFKRHGQLVPALGRPIPNDPTYDLELIYGARRLFVACHLNTPLLVEIREMTDREAVVAMDIENRARRDVSAYERGRAYATWLRDGLFASQDELAQSLNISASRVSRLLKIARLPPVVLSAFRSPADICELWGLELATALEDPNRRDHTIRMARSIAHSNTPLSPREICKGILSAKAAKREGTPSRDEVVFDSERRPLFRIRYGRVNFALLLPCAEVSRSKLYAARDAVRAILLSEKSQASENSTVSVRAITIESGISSPATPIAPCAQGITNLNIDPLP